MAPRLGFRAATMPGFSREMVPALRLDYTEINRRVNYLKDLLDDSIGADFLFVVDGSTEYELHLDLRHRTAHASGGLLREKGIAGNLPSGKPTSSPTRARPRVTRPPATARYRFSSGTRLWSSRSRTTGR